YIAARAFGKYFGAKAGATVTHMPDTVRKYLGLTLLPHSGVSLVFTGIICSTLSSAPELVKIVQGTIAAAAVINEFIAVIAAKKGFELAGEIKHASRQ
ncbi:MAG: potassium transporter, partial [Acetatifactor sp.]